MESGMYYQKRSLSYILFISIYVILVIFSFASKLQQQTQDIFIPWEQFSGIQLISLGAAIALSFFVPGYALVITLDRKDELKFLPKLLLGYIFSTLLTGLVCFITALIGFPVLDNNILLNLIYIAILILFVKVNILNTNILKSLCYPNLRIFWQLFKEKSSTLLVLSSLFALVILSTYYLYSGTLIGDQWFYHGKALIFLSGAFRDFAVHNVDLPYPPFLPALLSGFFTLSDVPSANAYVSINFLNMMPVLAFYYFFSKWVPPNRKASALLASTLFMLSSGFGWAYVISLTAGDPITSQESALKIFLIGGLRTFDVWLPNTFIGAGHPDITSGLIILALPAGFVLLGLLKEQINGKLKYIAILAGVSTLGYLSHDEFGLLVIAASVLPLIFRLNGKGSIFVALLVALSIAILSDILFPGKYYSSRHVFGLPFIVLYFSFVASMWALYYFPSRVWTHRPKTLPLQAIYGYRKKISSFVSAINLPNVLKKFVKGRIRLILGVVIISIVSYLYVFSFIIWVVQSSTFDVRLNTDNFRVVPWHFYPLRFGVTGLLGLAFILSYLFKRFEKEVFVFGIIAVIAFFAGPYYNEHRFNKYIMVSMAGFASLLLYEIFFTQHIKKPVIMGILLGFVVTSSSLSILMYAGYSELGLENPDLDEFNTSAPRRHFPSPSEIHMLSVIHDRLNLKTDNVAVTAGKTGGFSYFYLIQDHALIAKLEGFTGIPVARLAQSSTAMNTSSLEGFYTLLHDSNTRYIVLPKQRNIDSGLSEINRFALEHFPRIYENDNYIVSSVPPLVPPTSEGEIALVFQDPKQKKIPPLISSSVMQYADDSLVLDDNSINSTKIEKTEILKPGFSSLWSNRLYEGINYAEVKFRIISENKTANHAGILWEDGEKQYYALLRSNSLSIYTPVDGEFLSTNLDYPREKGAWYTLEIEYDNNKTINIFLNDVLAIQIPKVSSEGGISFVGISSFNAVTEFEPLKIGMTAKLTTEPIRFDTRYNYYYPFNTLALSKTKYETFMDGDFSAFSKRNAILTFDPSDTDVYLEYLKSGGTLVIANTDHNFKGGFSNLLSLRPGNETKFNSIAPHSEGQAIKVSGVTRDIKVNSPNSVVKSFYLNGGQEVAPFAIEKKYDNGTIIFVNAAGYFNSIAKSPDKLFLTLGDLPRLIGLNTEKLIDVGAINSIPATRFLGGLKMYGQVLINSSSLSLPKGYDLEAQNISLLNQKDSNFLTRSGINNESQLNDTSIRDLKLYGTFKVQINSTGLKYLPSLSKNNYITASLPEGFDMTVSLFNGSKAELFLGKDNRQQHTFRITDGEIYFHAIKSESPNVNSIPLLIKSPQMKVSGKANFQKLHSADPNDPMMPWAGGGPAEFTGTLIAKFDHVDNYPNNMPPPITYLKWIKVDGMIGNASEDTKEKILETPLEQARNLEISTKLIVAISVMAIVSIYVFGGRGRKKEVHDGDKYS